MTAPIIYRSFLSGAYSVQPGLLKLGQQPVPWREDGQPESHFFALDDEYGRYIAAKVASHERALHEHAGEASLRPELRQAALEFIAQTLAAESSGVMSWDGQTLRNAWLGWEADLDCCWGAVSGLRRFAGPLAHLVEGVQPISALDFLGLNAQEDLTITARGPQGDWLAATHVLIPQHWDPRDKLGRDFVSVHTPVAGMAAVSATAPRLLDAVITRGPFVRFAWGLSMTDRLDHHPAGPPDADRAHGTRFEAEQAFLRVERQTLKGFPQAQGALFTIRPYTYPLTQVVSQPEHAAQLAKSLRSMTPEQVRYKGLSEILADLLLWLDARAETGIVHS